MSHSPLSLYGYPEDENYFTSQASSLAGAMVPTRRSINRRYGQAIGDVRGFTRALLDLLGGSAGAIPGAYAPAIQAEEATRAAAAARLAELGPEYAGAGIAAGAAGESSISALRERQAAGGEYEARLPGIAASRGALGVIGLVNARNEALGKREEDMQSAFVRALQEVRQNALQIAMANAEISQGERGLDLRELEILQGGAGFDLNDDYQQVYDTMVNRATDMWERAVPLDPNVPALGETREEVPYKEAFRRLQSYARPLLRQLGYTNSQVRAEVRKALQAAGYPTRRRRPDQGPSAAPTANDVLGGFFG